MVPNEAALVRWVLFGLAVAAVAYGLWWFLIRKPPRRTGTLFPAPDR